MKKSLSESSYIVQTKSLIRPATHVICALSGGQDSILLFTILLHLKKVWNLKISVVYCHHFWQLQNMYTVKEIWKLTFLFQIPICLFFAEDKLQSEASARVWRQNKFCRSLEFFHSYTIAMGHTASDRIETALWHIARGTSPKGLMSLQPYREFRSHQFTRTSDQLPFFFQQDQQNIDKIEYVWKPEFQQKSLNKTTSQLFWNRPFKRCFSPYDDIRIFHKAFGNYTDVKISSRYERVCCKKKKNYNTEIPTIFGNFGIVRPLYDFHRCDVNLIVSQNNLPRITDRTNQNMIFTRNRIRSEILPLLRYFINRQNDLHLYTYLQMNEVQQTFLETLLRTLIESYCNIPKSIELLLQLPEALQSECIYLIVKSYTARQISILQIKKLRSWID
jgi:tRNA(Ile)-lysidine synthase TilS/MesJ